MKKLHYILLVVFTLSLQAQEDTTIKKGTLVITTEVLFGKTFPSNYGFPETGVHKQLMLNIGKEYQNAPQQWAQRFKGLQTGVGIGVSDFGQLELLGVAITAIPYIEFNAFGSSRFKVLTALGASYFTEKYDPIYNPNNRAVSTDITWAFRLFLYYKLLSTKNVNWRLGLGFSHHSNGHTRLDNSGYNSILMGVSGAIHAPFKNSTNIEGNTVNKPLYQKSKHGYIEFRTGHGWNVLAEAFNNIKPVYTISGEYGYVLNSVFKIGLGAHYRFYQHYYDYINNEESLVQDGREFESFKERPFYHATSLAVYLNAEFLIAHFGIDISLGYNIYKEAYKIDWRINEGWVNTPRDIPVGWELGGFNTKYTLKKSINTRLGIKYYLLNTQEKPQHNVFTGAHLNSNLGQADFTELSLGYIYTFNTK
tara:strand:+ start:2607 stop:3869 length:1263 start_codon:yes stop_codon:yes gene_type:complete